MYVIIGCKSNSFIGFSVFFHYLFLHLRSHSRRNSDVDMQALLNDIELDIQELKCLMEAVSRKPDSALREVAKRNIVQMRGRLDILLEQLDRGAIPENELPDRIINPMPEPVSAAAAEEEEEEEEEGKKEESAIVEEPVVETVVKEEEPKSAVLGESLKLSAGLRHAISLNDSFRFSRELFGGNTDLMNRVIEQISVMSSYKTAVAFLSSKVELNEEKEAVNDFLELLKKYFNQSA